ncbi:MAG: GerMN domain-containing protein, partial [Lachnospiraceae bacterium]|nr:GerMN domain-containing protein [Lachnospiraceae bacterium]
MKSLADLKKLIMMICLCTLSVTCLCSCALTLPGKSGEDSVPDGSVKIYCFDREENTLSAYDHILNSNDAGSTASELIEEMKKTPENIEIKEVIRDFDVISCDVEGSQIVVTVDERYNLLEPTREILTRAAIVRTLGQIEGIDRIAIKVRGEDLTDSLGQPVGLMSVADFVDNPGDEINAYENKELALYFADIDGTGLVKATRTVEYNTS